MIKTIYHYFNYRIINKGISRDSRSNMKAYMCYIIIFNSLLLSIQVISSVNDISITLDDMIILRGIYERHSFFINAFRRDLVVFDDIKFLKERNGLVRKNCDELHFLLSTCKQKYGDNKEAAKSIIEIIKLTAEADTLSMQYQLKINGLIN